MRRILTRTLCLALSGLVVALCVPLFGHTDEGRGSNSISIDDLEANDIDVVHFTVTKESLVHIDAVGAEYQSGYGMFAYPWIIESNTRDLAWSMAEEVNEPYEDSPWLRQFDDEVRLKRGSYSLYYYAGQPNMLLSDMEFESFSEFMDNLGEAIDRLKRYYDEDSKELDISFDKVARECYVTVEGDHIKEGRGEFRREMKVAIFEPDNDAYEQVSFSLSEKTELEIYALGEYWAASGSLVDWGWITDARSGKNVWEMTYDNTDFAGGAEKNRRFRGRITLPKGKYTAHYVTDDSHTYDGWNSPPPYDPDGWGIWIYPADSDDLGTLTLRTDEPSARKPLVRLAGVGDNELVSRAFRVTKPTPLRLYALGEYDRYHDKMADYGWVVKNDDNETTVWVMTGSNTEPAGGGDKNRQFDGIIEFEPGEYVVWYASDGSHSYADGWNSSPPHDQKSYGVTILQVDEDLDAGEFQVIELDEVQTKGQLVALSCRGNEQTCKEKFTLPAATKVRIRGIGEGSRNGMSDDGWIENRSTGDVVWEMTYRKTKHAGGAEKNREVNQVILLDKGEYVAYFTSDDSHSLNDWNADPPTIQSYWGLHITALEGEGF